MDGDPRGEGVALLLVDGDNLLHAVRGGRDDGGVAWLLPRLSRWRPAGTRVVVALDGHPAHGESSRRRVATGIEFHHAGTRSGRRPHRRPPGAAALRGPRSVRRRDAGRRPHRSRPSGRRADPVVGLARQPAGCADRGHKSRCPRGWHPHRPGATRAPSGRRHGPGRGATPLAAWSRRDPQAGQPTSRRQGATAALDARLPPCPRMPCPRTPGAPSLTG